MSLRFVLGSGDAADEVQMRPMNWGTNRSWMDNRQSTRRCNYALVEEWSDVESRLGGFVRASIPRGEET